MPNYQDITGVMRFGGGYVVDMAASLGFGSTPSTTDIKVVVDTDAGQTFATGLLNPGNISGFAVGGYKFTGIVQYWKENFGSDGRTYDIKLVDPRVMFNDVSVLMQGTGPSLPVAPYLTLGSGIANVINVYNVFGNDYAADYNDNGMSWNNIKYALEFTSGYLNVYGQPFRLSFDSGWNAPAYLRINTQEATLTSLLDTTAAQLGIEYFVEIDHDTFVANTGVVNKINVRSIDRSSDATSGENLETFLNANKASGLLMNYQKGRELRNGPTDVIVQGSPYSFLYTATDYIPSYGRLANGALLTGGGNSTTFGSIAADSSDRSDGFVVVENILNGQTIAEIEAENGVSIPSLSYDGKQRRMAGGVYPPQVLDITLSPAIPGYKPPENVMRAALFSRQSWETLLYWEQPSVAAQLGISGMYVRSSDGVLAQVAIGDYNKVRPESLISDQLYRTPSNEALIGLFYEFTREAAETYYGKEFVVNLPLGSFSYGSTTGYGTTINYRYGYAVVDSAWYENASIDFRASSNTSFRTDDGRHKAHVIVDDYNFEQDPGVIIQFPYSRLATSGVYIDLSKIDKGNYFIDADSVRVTCSVEQDVTNLGRAIVRLSAPIEITEVVTGDIPSSYVQFWRALGCTDTQIYGTATTQGVGRNTDLWGVLGLAPQRLRKFGAIYIPLENQTKRYGPFIASSNNRSGGTAYIVDDSLNPWSYGGFYGMNAAGTGIANAAISDKIVIDNASFTLAGIPKYNLGDLIGESNNISFMAINVSRNGLTTNYALQSFQNPNARYIKQNNMKVNKIVTLSNKLNKDIINLKDLINRGSLENDVYTIGTNPADLSSFNWGDKYMSGKSYEKRPYRTGDIVVG